MPRPQALLSLLSLVALLAFAPPAAADFQYQVYAGTFDVLPNFATLTPVASGQSTSISLSVTTRVDNFALVFTNTLNVQTAGLYEFQTNSDDGSKLYVDGVLVVDNDGLHGPVKKAGAVGLQAGMHRLRIEYFNGGGGKELEVSWKGPGFAEQVVPAGALFH